MQAERELDKHQAKIDWLLGLDRSEVQTKQLAALVNGMKRGELTVEDVTSYTDITPEQLAELMRA